MNPFHPPWKETRNWVSVRPTQKVAFLAERCEEGPCKIRISQAFFGPPAGGAGKQGSTEGSMGAPSAAAAVLTSFQRAAQSERCH